VEVSYIFLDMYFIFYLLLYLIVHLPFDILMIFKRGDAKYPSPPFKNIIQGICFVIPSLLFWGYITIVPLASLFLQADLYLLPILNFIPSVVKFISQFIGLIIASIGLFIDALGRIGRGPYLKNQKPVLSTTWGHAIVRHPSYFHYITGFISIPLITFNPILFILIFGIYGYVSVTNTEEKALIEYFGEDYIKYINKVGKIFPKIRKGGN
jgi:protein-S-isoprenylcysteine O-methyltransferase Ste14